MAYVHGNGASSRYGIMGVPVHPQGHPPGPKNNFRTSEETHEESVQRKQAFTKVPMTDFDAVAHTLRTARVMAEATANDQEVQQTYGQHCRYIEGKVAEFSAGLQTYKEFGPGCVIVPLQLWQAMTELAEWCMPVLQAVREITKPVKLVVQNGQSVDQARQLGTYDDAER